MRFVIIFAGALTMAGQTLASDRLELEGLTPETNPQTAMPVCENIPFDKANCVRALACLGSDGVYFDGQAHGWDTGIVIGYLNDGTACEGNWVAGGTDTPGRASLQCGADLEANVLYHTLDNETGTVIGSGTDSLGREITVWSGEKVLQFLTGPDDDSPALPCGPAPIPIS
ncbi:hypothetical protein [Marivita hallyeonensis]|uniref:Uncharacterized protein n=1 Tax=Marivita hallyeonensis TaxID=996342 RepID=A0A1M5TNN0_9RHOB|nr:hypothetical protein [Marivita hallyeonensis]SHH51983.1 hypothetical protein SAMN05443551_2292 [Marivita hallyeonensis]